MAAARLHALAWVSSSADPVLPSFVLGGDAMKAPEPTPESLEDHEDCRHSVPCDEYCTQCAGDDSDES